MAHWETPSFEEVSVSAEASAYMGNWDEMAGP
jgi:coenzyme PQQ precursor peptide PqqA